MYKAVRAGVQDVAVKFLHRANADDLQKFIEVGRSRCYSALPAATAAVVALLLFRMQLHLPCHFRLCPAKQVLMHPVASAVAQEVSILKSLNYDKNIVQFYGACMRPGQDLMLVTEVGRGGLLCIHRCIAGSLSSGCCRRPCDSALLLQH